MNFNYWIELDGEFISNELDLSEAERKAQKIASALGEQKFDRLDFWSAPLEVKCNLIE
jgi:hypothetical protein